MNSVDTTNGYILEKEQIDEVPLPTEVLPDWRFFPLA